MPTTIALRNSHQNCLQRAKAARPDLPVGLVLAKREYEAWFLGAIGSLDGQHGLACKGEEIADPESIRGAKGRLEHSCPGAIICAKGRPSTPDQMLRHGRRPTPLPFVRQVPAGDRPAVERSIPREGRLGQELTQSSVRPVLFPS